MCTCYPIINRVSELKVHIELTRFVQPEKIEIDANERAVNEKSQYCFFVCTTFDSFLNDFVEDGSNLSDISSSPLSDKGYGNISVTLKKEQNSDENVGKILSGGKITGSSGGDYSSAIKNIENTTVRQYIFTVEVTAYYEDAAYTYRTEYTRAEKYPVTFTHNGNTIVWVANAAGGGTWKVGNSSGAVYTIDDNTPIHYTYNRTASTSCRFEENIYQNSQEGGDTSAAN